MAKIIAIIMVVMLLIASGVVIVRASAETVTITVTDKERTSGEDGKWLVFTEIKGGTETFQITDSFVYCAWNSSDRYGKLKKDRTYKVRVYGWRIPIISGHRNIIEVKREFPRINPD